MIRKLFSTSVFRLSLVYALVFSVIAAVAMMSLYWVAEQQLEQQTDARLELETNVLMQHYSTGNVGALDQTIRLRNQDDGTSFFLYALISRHEIDLVSSLLPERYSADRTQFFTTMTLGNLVSFLPEQRRSDKVRLMLTQLPGGFQLLVGSDLDEQYTLLRRLQNAIAWAITIIVTSSLLGGVIMGYKVLQRINAVTRTADEIIQGDLSHRMPIMRGADEFDRLSNALNRMLERIEQLMKGMREVTDNLAHDLRNPLNRLRHRLESIQLSTDKDNIPYAIDEAVQDVDGLINTFNALLSIAQVEAGSQGQTKERVDFSLLLADLAETYQIVAEEAGLEWQQDCVAGLEVTGNRQLLAQLVINLLDNAVKYTPVSGCISLHAVHTEQGIVLTISDTGVGIPANEREAVLKRFYRLEQSRTTAGNGLGLSLVKAIADWHHAALSLEDNTPQGLRVRVVFINECLT